MLQRLLRLLRLGMFWWWEIGSMRTTTLNLPPPQLQYISTYYSGAQRTDGKVSAPPQAVACCHCAPRSVAQRDTDETGPVRDVQPQYQIASMEGLQIIFWQTSSLREQTQQNGFLARLGLEGFIRICALTQIARSAASSCGGAPPWKYIAAPPPFESASSEQRHQFLPYPIYLTLSA
ncbi:hypothetical protein K402DRAFT_159618 [Aulographum hederae CBS 113979]|uniref:Secreted protein n=1 Tax=Aulographum hederae CBS 113979 TaxID=1176131 RepID=A0A6G1GSC0_9PEZI|nr:hypothetical protein K402DRAFT_159618 [Aulographum hederae CBS 113979]